MELLENNDFMILNNIIYHIHTMKNFTSMQKEVLEQMKLIVSFDCAEFSLSEGKGSCVLTHQVSYNCGGNLSKKFEHLDYSQGILTSGTSMVYRESDILSESKRVQTEYYKKVYEVNHWHHAMQMVLGYEHNFVGVITLYKLKGKEDFHFSDIQKLDFLKEHFAYRVYKQQEELGELGKKLTLEQAKTKFSLTPREMEILGYLMRGIENESICNSTFITNNTLKKHILNIYKKMNVNNRTQLFKLIQDNM